MITEEMKQDLIRFSELTVFFGHQSVGMDILRGVEELYQAAGLPEYPVIDVHRQSAHEGPAMYHLFAGKNGDPAGKCLDFETAMHRQFPEAGPDVAFLKFCYADFRDSTDLVGVLRSYRSTIERLKSRYPITRVYYVTVPVTARSVWWKRLARSVLGRKDPWDQAAFARQEFNQALMREVGREEVFDLAVIESTRPDGTRSIFEYQGKEVASIVDDYTYDGGHLNERGRAAVAQALIRFTTAAK